MELLRLTGTICGRLKAEIHAIQAEGEALSLPDKVDDEDVNAAGYVLQISGDCFAQLRVEDVQEDPDFSCLQIVFDRI